MQTFLYDITDDNILKDFDIYARQFSHIAMEIFGHVQGVGFRPYIYNLATALHVYGYVRNVSNCVFICLEYNPNVRDFISRLINTNKANIHIESLHVSYYMDNKSYSNFVIASSIVSKQSSLNMQLPLDYKICEECMEDMRDKHTRFYNYAFVSCVNCGARYSILHSLPYSRDNTSMAKCCMCKTCFKDYNDTFNRRFRSEQASCNYCKINIKTYRFYNDRTELIGDNESSLMLVAKALINNEAVIYKGLGGFAYLANAKSTQAVKKLRALKKRPHKPLVVMTNLERLKSLALVDKDILDLLDSKESPIILTHKARDYDLSDEVSNLNTIGIMIPYTPMLILLFDILGKDFVVCYTSANKKGDMIANDINLLDREEILSTLESFCEKARYKGVPNILVLDYDREITHRLDDSIISSLSGSDYKDNAIKSCADIVKDRFHAIRISRGFSPMKLVFKNLSLKAPSMSFGAMQKSSISFGMDNIIATSSYMGDLFSLHNIDNFLNHIHFFLSLYGKPEYLLIDAHPQYESSRVALDLSRSLLKDSKVISVFHHHAHMNALLLESNMQEGLGIIFDGSGFGADNSIWGGEFLYGNFRDIKRELHFKPFRILGGQKHIRDSKRLLLGYALCNNIVEIIEYLDYKTEEFKILHTMHTNAINSPLTSSIGRIFDIVSFILGLRNISYAEQSGELVTSLAYNALDSNDIALLAKRDLSLQQAIYNNYALAFSNTCKILESTLPKTNIAFNPYEFYIKDTQIDLSSCIRSIFNDVNSGIAREIIALRFIDTLAFCVLEGMRKIGVDRALFGGGVFGNYVLCNRIKELFSCYGMKFFFPKLPCNDYSISIGQLAVLSSNV